MLPVICLEPTRKNFPNGITKFVFSDGRYYQFHHRDGNGNYCYNLMAAGFGRKKKNPSPISHNRICTGQITFVASNACNGGAPEEFDVAFVLNPLGELFVPNDPCAAGDHNYSSFLCNDSTAVIRTKLLASLRPQFLGKIDFSVLRSDSSGTGFDRFTIPVIIQSDRKTTSKSNRIYCKIGIQSNNIA